MIRTTSGTRVRGSLLAVAILLASCGPRTAPVTEGSIEDSEHLALVGATVHPSPTGTPLDDAVVLVHGGTIAEVGPRSAVTIPAGARVIDCRAMHLVAGFQNSHVHFTEAKWEGAAGQPADRLSAQLEEMLLRYGFTTVVDVASPLDQTLELRRRIESGEVRGPRILTAGSALYPEDGIPFYLEGTLPPEVLARLPTPATGEEAAAIVADQIGRGADVVKLFVGSWVERGRVLPMSTEVARAAVTAAHERGRPVFAHGSSIAGLEVALDAGVDVLAHALDDDRGWDETYVARMKEQRMAMIPTLKLFAGQPYTKYIQLEVRDYAEAAGQILFGTDVGFLTDYDPSEEYELLSGSGLDWRAILAALTTAPAERFGETDRRGRVAPGLEADLVVLGSDPASAVTAFADVRYTVRGGRIVYGSTGG